MTLEGKAAIVTGSDSGIGHAIALELAGRGASVTVNYHMNAEAADATLAAIEAAGGKAQVIQADVSSVADIGKLVDGTVAAFGRLDILVNNAGMETRTSTLDTTEHQFDMVIAIDLKSAFFGVQAAARQMIKQGGGGRIINIIVDPRGLADAGQRAVLPGQGRGPDADPDRRRRAGARTASPSSGSRPARSTRRSTRSPCRTRSPGPGSRARSPSGGSRNPRRSPGWSRSWPRTRPRTGPPRPTSPTAA